MTEELVLSGLLLLALVCAVIVILVSTATVGRKLADLEYQQDSEVDGVRRIQANINVRTHANRVMLGVTFVVITVLLLANAPLEVRTWTNRVLFAVVMASYANASIMDWRDERTQLKILQGQSRDTHRRDVEAGIKGAEDRAEVKADALAKVAVVIAEAGEVTPVDAAAIQPEAAQAIADAVTPRATRGALEAIADALPPPPPERGA